MYFLHFMYSLVNQGAQSNIKISPGPSVCPS